MELDLKGLEDRVRKVEAEVAGLREIIRRRLHEEVDLDELSTSIARHSVTDSDLDRILSIIRRCRRCPR